MAGFPLSPRGNPPVCSTDWTSISYYRSIWRKKGSVKEGLGSIPDLAVHPGAEAAEQETERLYILCQRCYIEPAFFRFPGP